MPNDCPKPHHAGGNRVFSPEEMRAAFGEHPSASWTYVEPPRLRGVPWYKQPEHLANLIRSHGADSEESFEPWPALSETEREFFRQIVGGNAGASLG